MALIATTIVAAGISVIDDERRAMRRGTHNRLTMVLRCICATDDYRLNFRINKRHGTAQPQYCAAPAEGEIILAALQELIITTRGIEPQHVAAPIVLQADVENRLQRVLESKTTDLFALRQTVPASRAEVNSGVNPGIRILLRGL